MFSLLSLDPILLIIFNLTNIHDVINLSEINKNIKNIFDDDLYLYWGRNLYTKNFWDKAKQRTPSLSKPLICMKFEILRIHNFQNELLKMGYQPWNNEDFFVYWEGLERSRGTVCRGTPCRGTPPSPRMVGITHHLNNRVSAEIVSPTNDEIYDVLNML